MIQSILSNLAILLLGHLVMTALVTYQSRLPKNLFSILSVALFSSTVIAMFYLPIQFGEFRLDLRLIPLIILAMFRGWKITIPVLVIASLWRLGMGSSGALPGVVFGMLLPTIFALIYYKYNRNFQNFVEKIIVVSACWFISDFPIVFILPDGWTVFKDIFLLRYGSFLIATFTYYAFIQLEYKRRALTNELSFLATHDSLTKLLNKSAFVEKVEDRLSNNLHTKKYIAMIDIDHFKKLNDSLGHLAGDQTLISLATLFKKYENENVFIARYGGEEFIIYQETASAREAVEIIENIQQTIRHTPLPLADNQTISITASIGLAEVESESSLLEAIRQADENLYSAKAKGRDQLIQSVLK